MKPSLVAQIRHTYILAWLYEKHLQQVSTEKRQLMMHMGESMYNSRRDVLPSGVFTSMKGGCTQIFGFVEISVFKHHLTLTQLDLFCLRKAQFYCKGWYQHSIPGKPGVHFSIGQVNKCSVRSCRIYICIPAIFTTRYVSESSEDISRATRLCIRCTGKARN